MSADENKELREEEAPDSAISEETVAEDVADAADVLAEDEDDLEAQMAAAMAAEAAGGGEDDLEAQMAATMALEEDADGVSEDDLEAQMAAAMQAEAVDETPASLDMDALADDPGVISGGASVPVQSLEMHQLRPSEEAVDKDSIDRLLDVTLNLAVELGRKDMQIREILDLGPGKIIELDKLAGEPVDLLVNGKLLAKGEVVVVDENFGVRITDLIDPEDRIKML